MKCGLLGRKLGHSYSPQIHAHLGDYSYELFEKEPEEVADFLQNGDFSTINVTIPYKKTVMPYCSKLTERAVAMGSVNTIVRQPDGTLLGHNTDYFGFSSMVRRSGLDPKGKKVLVLGSGGASVTAVAVLKEMGANVVVISRSGEDNYENLHRHADASILCNCTPVGMYPHNGLSPVDISLFPRLEGVLDMIYNPARTKLLLEAEKRGLVAENGLWMLVAQAKEAAEWFTGVPISDDKIAEIHAVLRRQMENIILIGMPGSGKSTVGQLLAEKCGKTFVDADAEIEKAAGKSIPEIFAESGEEGFRAWETKVLEDLGKRSGIVLATGGGCVTREENYEVLHQNGTIFCLNRSLDRLPTEGRPLSKTNKLEEMYRVRKPLYDRFADHHIDNNGTPEDAVRAILSDWEENT
jgi:shikimate dehydrogenase